MPTRLKDFIRTLAIGFIWCLLIWAGFLAMDYQDDILLGLYIVAGATGVSALIGWALR
ncbi:MAG: hypothetical protein WAL80_10415 [Xanthobacteraceae bacterium]|jgi:hypothetical protein